MTQGVVKNIIPAIASTNAIIAASCCNEALKLASMMNPCLGMPETNNYMMYSGDEGVYTYTFEHMKKDDCPVCGTLAKRLDVDPNSTLRDLIESFAVRPEAYVQIFPSKFHLLIQDIVNSRNPLFVQKPSLYTIKRHQAWKSRQDQT